MAFAVAHPDMLVTVRFRTEIAELHEFLVSMCISAPLGAVALLVLWLPRDPL